MKYALLLLALVGTAQASLINQAPAQVTKDSSLQDRQAATISAMKQGNTQAVSFLKGALTRGYQLTFKNQLGLSPAEVMAAYGADACRAHMAFLGAAQLISAADPLFVAPTEPCTITCNQDGTVNVACPQPSPTPSPSPAE